MNRSPGRNDPCWCGSGKKYKKCHARSEDDRGTGLFGRWVPNFPRLDEEGREGMRAAGRFNAQVMDRVRGHIVEGIRTEEIDRLVHEYTLDHGHTPACLGYRGFPKSCCTSINEVVCHGIPDATPLESGDIINVDVTTIVDGWHGDQSETFLIGECTEEARHLVQVTFECLHLGIDAIRPYGKVVDIGTAIVPHAHRHGFSVVREYQGHGIGREFHQQPDIPHFPDSRLDGVELPPGVCFTVEPMINAGTWKTCLDRRDGWTVRTTDGRLTAQFEHTILVTETGVEILTQTDRGPRKGHQF